ncbi:MAG: M16 family metallopeptidase [Candidatus Eiseniibacteriota bacterium]
MIAAARRSVLAGGLWALLALAPAVPSRAAPVSLPPVTRARLKNGLTVLIVPNHRLPVVSLRLVARAGSAMDPPGREGLAGLSANLMTQGAGARSARQLVEDIEFVGGALDASAGAEQLVVTCEILSRNLNLGLELFHDVIVLPTFPPEEFARGKSEALASIASDRDDPATVADNGALPFAFGQSALGHPVSGWERSVSAVTRAEVVAFHAGHVTPANSMLAVVGDVDPAALLAELQQRFADWKAPAGGTPAPAITPPALSAGRQVRILAKPEVTQTQIRLISMGVARNHPDYYPITIANTILGAGFTSRLVNAIRVEQGLTYSIDSEFHMYRDAGTFGVSTFTRNATLRRTIDETLRVIHSLIEDGPTADELEKAKRYLTGQFPLQLQAPGSLARALLDIEFYGLDPATLQVHDDRVNAVTLDDTRRVLRSYFDIDHLKILVVSNPDSARAALGGLGTLEVQEIP